MALSQAAGSSQSHKLTNKHYAVSAPFCSPRSQPLLGLGPWRRRATAGAERGRLHRRLDGSPAMRRWSRRRRRTGWGWRGAAARRGAAHTLCHCLTWRGREGRRRCGWLWVLCFDWGRLGFRCNGVLLGLLGCCLLGSRSHGHKWHLCTTRVDRVPGKGTRNPQYYFGYRGSAPELVFGFLRFGFFGYGFGFIGFGLWVSGFLPSPRNGGCQTRPM